MVNRSFPPKFDSAKPFVDGLAIVGIKTGEHTYEYGYINNKGDYSITPRFFNASPFFKGIAQVSDQNTYPSKNYINLKGELLYTVDKKKVKSK